MQERAPHPMLDALCRFGKSLPLAVLSAATLAVGAQSVSIAPGYPNLGLNQTLQYTATVTGLANTTVTWEVNSIKGGNSTISPAPQNYSLYAQNRQGLALSQNSLLP